MSQRRIYFAGAIRGGRDDAALYAEIVGMLAEYGEVLTEHVGSSALTSSGESGNDKEIHDRDLSWLAQSDALVAEVTMPSLGVGYEIGKATEWGKPVLCLFRKSPDRALSAMIAGCQTVNVCEYQSAAELKPIFDEFFVANRYDASAAP